MKPRTDDAEPGADAGRPDRTDRRQREADSRKGEQAVIRVRLLLFGAAREAAATDEAMLDVGARATAREAFERALAEYPDLRRFRSSLLVAVNQEYARDLEVELKDGDEIALFPPVSGGSDERAAPSEEVERAAHAGDDGPQDFFELTTEPIDVGAIARRVVPSRCGATVTLDGYAREWTDNRRTLYLVYEAYAPMALAEMRRLGEEAHQRFDIAHVGVVHRTGRTDIGETSVVIAVSAPHRRAAFEACEWAIRELKRTVPIWKKEFFEDGSVWVEGEGAPEHLPSGATAKED
ncbi:MAG TPA: molybdenum cofactor biosynthesis protein MoaE [Pyrinomonadaceae bacterium]|jgi:molybdopterin synthase catalytic subunit|nr:molybdenum cofactor biosynthesis protein MoaE [Pyrinomonadaceae bacterium]